MLALGLQGPYPLPEASHRVQPASMGVYVLSRNRRVASYVGRSDSDLQQRIVSSASEGRYVAFWFDYASSPMGAYKYECELYHRYDPPDNTAHPAVPPGTNWRCPIPGCPWN